MLKQVILAHFEPLLTRFGPWKIPKCLESGPYWDQKWVKNGSKRVFPKVIPDHLGCSNKCLEPQKVGGCGWTRCSRNRFLSHVAQDTARAWFRGVGAHGADFGAFWRLFGPFLGHIVELKGTREVFHTVKSSRTCSVVTVSLRLGVSPGF